MSTIDTIFEDCLMGRIEALKDLYSEFFLLMDINLDERPELSEDPPPTTDLDKTISGLMDDIQIRMNELREFLDGRKNWRTQCGTETLDIVDEFQEKLAAGLEAILGRVEVRGAELRQAGADVKAELVGLSGKKRSNAAYQGRSNAPSTLFDSKA